MSHDSLTDIDPERLLVRSAVWNWAPRMRLKDGREVAAVVDGRPVVLAHPGYDHITVHVAPEEALPDLTDAATLGIIIFDLLWTADRRRDLMRALNVSSRDSWPALILAAARRG